MSKKEDAEFSAWLEDLAGSLAPEDSTLLKSWAQKAPEKFREKFRDGLREGDYYRKLERLNANARELARREREIGSLVQTREQEIAEERRRAAELQKRLELTEAQLAAMGLTTEEEPGGNQVMSDVSKEDVAKLREALEAQKARLEAMDRAFPAVLAESLEVGAEIAKEGWKVSPSEVLRLSLERQQPPKAILQTLTKEERESREKDRFEKEKAKWMEEGRREVLSRLPSPDHLRPLGPTIVDTLREKGGAARHERVNAAVELYNKDFPGMPVV